MTDATSQPFFVVPVDASSDPTAELVLPTPVLPVDERPGWDPQLVGLGVDQEHEPVDPGFASGVELELGVGRLGAIGHGRPVAHAQQADIYVAARDRLDAQPSRRRVRRGKISQVHHHVAGRRHSPLHGCQVGAGRRELAQLRGVRHIDPPRRGIVRTHHHRLTVTRAASHAGRSSPAAIATRASPTVVRAVALGSGRVAKAPSPAPPLRSRSPRRACVSHPARFLADRAQRSNLRTSVVRRAHGCARSAQIRCHRAGGRGPGAGARWWAPSPVRLSARWAARVIWVGARGVVLAPGGAVAVVRDDRPRAWIGAVPRRAGGRCAPESANRPGPAWRLAHPGGAAGGCGPCARRVRYVAFLL